MTLTDLKPGDVVAYYPPSYGEGEVYAAKIEKVTGKTRISYHIKGKQFDEHGRERGERGLWGRRSHIVPMTPEIYAQVEAQRVTRSLKKQLARLKPADLTQEGQQELLALLLKLNPEEAL